MTMYVTKQQGVPTMFPRISNWMGFWVTQPTFSTGEMSLHNLGTQNLWEHMIIPWLYHSFIELNPNLWIYGCFKSHVCYPLNKVIPVPAPCTVTSDQVDVHRVQTLRSRRARLVFPDEACLQGLPALRARAAPVGQDAPVGDHGDCSLGRSWLNLP